MGVYAGRIGPVYVYNRILTPEEQQKLYERGMRVFHALNHQDLLDRLAGRPVIFEWTELSSEEWTVAYGGGDEPKE